MEAVAVESLEDTSFFVQLWVPEFLTMVAFYSFDHVATSGGLPAFAVTHPRVIAVTHPRVPDITHPRVPDTRVFACKAARFLSNSLVVP